MGVCMASRVAEQGCGHHVMWSSMHQTEEVTFSERREDSGQMCVCMGRGEDGKKTDAMQMWSLRDQTPMNFFSGR